MIKIKKEDKIMKDDSHIINTYKGFLIERYYDNNQDYYYFYKEIDANNLTKENVYCAGSFSPNWLCDKQLDNARLDLVKQIIDSYLENDICFAKTNNGMSFIEKSKYCIND